MPDGDPLDSPWNRELLKRLTELNPGVLAEMYLRLQLEFLQPPEGWFIFGTHLEYPGRLEFWGTGEDGMPLWERPVKPVRSVQQMVTEFHLRFDPRIAPHPAIPENGLRQLRKRLLAEEYRELWYADGQADLVGIADALGDITYVLYGTALTYGIDLDEVIAEIHRSNMTKEPGPTGKAVKGASYSPPDLSGILDG